MDALQKELADAVERHIDGGETPFETRADLDERKPEAVAEIQKVSVMGRKLLETASEGVATEIDLLLEARAGSREPVGHLGRQKPARLRPLASGLVDEVPRDPEGPGEKGAGAVILAEAPPEDQGRLLGQVVDLFEGKPAREREGPELGLRGDVASHELFVQIRHVAPYRKY